MKNLSEEHLGINSQKYAFWHGKNYSFGYTYNYEYELKKFIENKAHHESERVKSYKNGLQRGLE